MLVNYGNHAQLTLCAIRRLNSLSETEFNVFFVFLRNVS